jgi:HEAT repeat protein
VQALGKIGPDALDALLGALDSRYPDVREHAAGVLGSLGFRDRRIVVPLADRLRDPSDSVRAQALWALNALSPEARLLLPELKRAATDANAEVRLQTVGFMAKLGAPVVPLLLEALRDKDVKVQRQAVAALQTIETDDEALLKAVAPLLKDEDATVRQYAVSVLRRCGPHAVPLLLTALKDKSDGVRQLVILALQDAGGDDKGLRPALIEAAKDSDPYVRAGALGALTRFGTQAIPHLTAGLKDSSPLVRKAAATYLGRYNSSVAPQLIEALKDDDDIWFAAKKSLIELQGDNKKLMPLIVKALQDEDKGVRTGAAYVMERFGADAMPHLIKAMKDPEGSVQWAAVDTIDTIGASSPDTLRALAEVAADDQRAAKMRNGAIAAMLKMHGLDIYRTEPVKAVPGLVELLGDPKATTRWSAALTLYAIGPDAKDAVPALTKALKDPSMSVAQSAQYALKRIQAGAEK